MDENHNNNLSVSRSVRWLLIVFFASLMLTVSLSYSPLGVTEAKNISPLLFRISTKPTVVCSGGSVVVSAELVNQSQETIVIDRRFIWYRSTFRFSKHEPDGSIKGRIKTTTGDPGPEVSDETNYITLKPGQSHKDTRSFSLDDDFFRSTKTFTLQFTYGQFRDASVNGMPLFVGTIRSNTLELKIINCKRKADTKRSK